MVLHPFRTSFSDLLKISALKKSVLRRVDDSFIHCDSKKEITPKPINLETHNSGLFIL
jgi:hypothetical protein